MLRFTCPQCNKALRAPEDKAGSTVKCPECGNRFSIPDDREETEPPEAEEPNAPPDLGFDEDERPRRKKGKRSRNARTGKTIVLVLIGLWLLVQVLGWIGMVMAPSVEEILKQGAAANPNVQLTEQQKAQQESALAVIGKAGKIFTIGIAVVSFLVGATFFTFLYLGHNWARIVVAVLSLLGAACALFAIPTLLSAQGSYRIVLMLQIVLGEAVNLGTGITLLVSSSVKAHTSR